MTVFLLDGLADLLWWISLAWVTSSKGAAGGLVLAIVGVVTAVAIVPGGHLATRVGPAKVARWSIRVRAAVLLLWGMGVVASGDKANLWLVAGLAIPLAVVDGYHLPAMESVQLALLPAKAQSVATGLERLCNRVAQSGAAFLAVIFLDPGQVAVVSGVLLLLSIPLIRRFAPREIDAEPPEEAATSLLAGIRSVAHDRVLRISVPAHGAYNLLTGALMLVLLPLLVRSEGWGPQAYRWIAGAWGVGLLIGTVGGLVWPNFPRRGRPAAAMLLAAAVGAVSLTLAWSPVAVGAAAAAAVMGVLSGPIGQLMQGLIRERAADLPEGPSVVAVGTFAIVGLDPLGFAIGAAAAALLSARWGFATVGVVIVALGMRAGVSRRLRRLPHFQRPR
ncbi:MFS transporter [Allobranchiibius sp. GilTou38]|nr:MFS transporter [Allobranchiibius sp. GilTou38]MBO1768266.1 MFS transporter [Allobranchiibius sp. GilTou38]